MPVQPGSAAGGLITAPFGARLPNNTARVSEATTGLSRERITSSLNTFARAMFSPNVFPFAVTAVVSNNSPSLFSSAGSPPA